MTDFCIRRGGRGRLRREEHCVKTEVEIGTMQLQAKEHHKLLGATRTKKRTERNSSLEPSERMWPCQHLDFRLLAFRDVEEYMSVVFSHTVCGNLLQHPQKTNEIDTDYYCWKMRKLRLKKLSNLPEVLQLI